VRATGTTAAEALVAGVVRDAPATDEAAGA